MLTDHLKDVLAFQLKFDHAYGGHADGMSVAPVPRLPNKELALFRLRFLGEELVELGDALGLDVEVSVTWREIADWRTDTERLAEALDALVDLDYVLLGTVLQLGLGHVYQPAWSAVHAANLAKEPAPGAESGKGVIKPPGWRAPDHVPLIVLETTLAETKHV